MVVSGERVFADQALTRRIEEAEASLSADITGAIIRRGSIAGAFSRTFAGGMAVCAGRESPVTKVIGAGFDGAAPDDEIAALEAEYFAGGVAVRCEVASLADPAFVRQLTGRGYILNGFENVLARPLASLDGNPPELPAGASIVPTTDRQAWMDAIIDGFESPDTGVVATLGETFPRGVLEGMFVDLAATRGFTQCVAMVDGEVAGGANMRLYEGVAQLCGAATRPRFRRRGLQTAMLHARLRQAAAAGCDVAVVTTEPGSKSQQNAQRAGFALLYSRAVLVKQPPTVGA
jgi:ribosomal protein S18 acetylase RimI-like enzyme